MSESFTVPLLHLGPSPNQRHNRFRAAAMKKAVREITCLHARKAGLPAATEAKVIQYNVQWTPRKRRLDDLDNLVSQLKPCQDGLVDAGIIVDDSATWLTSTQPTQSRGKSPWIIVTVTVTDLLPPPTEQTTQA